MPTILPSCFRSAAGDSRRRSPEISPELIVTTSVYDTPIGLVSLSWSDSLLIDLRLSGEPLRLQVRPWPFWRRSGSQTFRLKNQNHRSVELSWDLRRARFPASDHPEPEAGFRIVVSVDGETVLAAGDLVAGGPATMVSRREHVVLGDSGAGRRSYRTAAWFGGREHEIGVEVGPRGRSGDVAMSVVVDGQHVLLVRRLRWKFRGTDKVEVAGAGWILVTWDLHDWLFDGDSAGNDGGVGEASPEDGHAVFVFKFENKGCFGNFGNSVVDNIEGHFREEVEKKFEGYFENKSLRSLSDGANKLRLGSRQEGGEKRRVRLLRKSLSSSSSSSLVMEWASQEEVELHKSEGFTLIVYAWKR